MPKKNFTPEQIIPKLREVEVNLSKQKSWLNVGDRSNNQVRPQSSLGN